MKRFAIALTVVLSTTYASQAQDLITVVVNDGLLTVSTNGIDTNGGGPTVDWVGFDVASSTGSLIPYDPPQAPLHTPFLFFLSNTEHSIVMASVPAPATVLAALDLLPSPEYNWSSHWGLQWRTAPARASGGS